MGNELSAYELAYGLVCEIEETLADVPTRHYFTRAGQRLTTLEEVVRALMCNDVMMTGGQMTTLEQIADNLKAGALAAPHQPQRFKLKGGLHLTCVFRVHSWQVSLTRVEVEPSGKEVDVIIRDFAIPKKRVERTEFKQNINGQACYVVRLSWPTADLQPSFDFAADGGAIATIRNHYVQESDTI